MVDSHSQRAKSPWRRDVEQDSSINIMTTERTPLISRASDGPEQSDQSQPHAETSAAESLHDIQGKNGTGRYRWPSLIALLALCIVAVLIIVFAFIAPSAVEQYATTAVVFAPTSLSIDSFTKSGVRARVQGNFEMDASRVKSSSVRNLGRFCTWIAREAETGPSEVQVFLPEYGNVLLGTAQIPGIKVYIRNGHTTPVDFLTDLKPGHVEGIRRIANDYIDGRLGQLRVVGKASVPVKSGLISLGKQFLEREMVFANKDIPSIPKYDIQNLNFREIDLPKGKGMAADVSLDVENPYPVSFTVPPLGFRILVDNCEEKDPLIQVAHALTNNIDISPSHVVNINVTGTVRQLPAPLTKSCPGSRNSPLDNLVESYLHNKPTTIYVQGSDSASEDTPKWITDLTSDITIPVPVPGKEMPGHLIKNFSLEDTHFSLPDPWATPGSPKSKPRITANVQALIALPKELESAPLNVSRVRADADVYYKKKKMGRLDLDKWQKATSHKGRERKDELEAQARVKDAPLEIQDQDVFSEVVEELIFGDGVVLEIRAKVDVGVEVGVLGEVVVRGVEASGKVPVKRPANIPAPGRGGGAGGNLTSHLKPALTSLRITHTTPKSLTLELILNITNPTPYSAWIPYIKIQLNKNESRMGHAVARNLSVVPGRNEGLVVGVVWEPYGQGGPEGERGGRIGRELISQYISSFPNLTLGIAMYEGSFPSNPILGRALGKFGIEVPLPNLSGGGGTPPPSDDDDHDDDDDDDDDGGKNGNETPPPHFLRDARMHLLTSTATFTLLSPLHTSTLWIDSLNATAFYDGEACGGIFYDEEPMGVVPVDQTPAGEGWETPRLPVTWKVGSVGYRAIRAALGGRLRLGAYAEVRVRIGEWREGVWFRGGGLGVRIGL